MVSLYNEKIISNLEKKIKMSFNDKLLLQRAITHKSFSNENNHLNLRDNERLEFLGDSVLSIVISTFIFDNFPDYPEGELAKMRSVIVSEPILAMQARDIQLGKYILLGKGEELSGGRERDSILADTMEALIGAIYLDLGIDMSREFIISNFNNIIMDVEKGKYIQDYKTILQELLQKDGIGRPLYQVVDEKGPDHNKSFIIDVLYQGNKIGSGKGSSKKEAEQNAAMSALKNMHII